MMMKYVYNFLLILQLNFLILVHSVAKALRNLGAFCNNSGITLVIHKIMCHGYPLECPYQDYANKYPKHDFIEIY